jgi:hypothetical protein
MNPKSDTLFHFTKTLENLESILSNGFQPRHCQEDIEWFGKSSHIRLAYPMVCFCDIPLSRLTKHVDSYGNYGLGLTKNWSLRNNLCPVIYTPPESSITKLANFLFNRIGSDNNPETIQILYRTLSLIKPLTGKMEAEGQFIDVDFYQENEWRYIPDKKSILFEHEYLSKKEYYNEKMEKYTLKFDPEDISYIFVDTDKDIPRLVDFIMNLDKIDTNALKILYTKIVSLERIVKDM